MFKEKNSNNTQFNLLNYLLQVIPKYLTYGIIINLTDNTISIKTNQTNLISLLNFLKNNYLLQFKTLISITAVDYPEKQERFEVNYFLLSYKLNTRITIKLTTNDITPVPSINSIYSSAN